MLQTTLTAKFPRDQSEGGLWRYLSELVLPGSTGETTPPAIQPVQLPNPLSLALPKAAHSVFSAEFTNAFFGIGEFTFGRNEDYFPVYFHTGILKTSLPLPLLPSFVIFKIEQLSFGNVYI